MKQTKIRDFKEIKDIHHSLLESEIDSYLVSESETDTDEHIYDFG